MESDSPVSEDKSTYSNHILCFSHWRTSRVYSTFDHFWT